MDDESNLYRLMLLSRSLSRHTRSDDRIWSEFSNWDIECSLILIGIFMLVSFERNIDAIANQLIHLNGAWQTTTVHSIFVWVITYSVKSAFTDHAQVTSVNYFCALWSPNTVQLPVRRARHLERALRGRRSILWRRLTPLQTFAGNVLATFQNPEEKFNHSSYSR